MGWTYSIFEKGVFVVHPSAHTVVHATVQAFYNFPSQESSTSVFLLKIPRVERLNARRFNSTLTALSATFTHFVAIIDISHKQISQWLPSHRGDPLELRLRLIVINLISTFGSFLEGWRFGLGKCYDLLSVGGRDEAKSLTHSLGFLLRLL